MYECVCERERVCGCVGGSLHMQPDVACPMDFISTKIDSAQHSRHYCDCVIKEDNNYDFPEQIFSYNIKATAMAGHIAFNNNYTHSTQYQFKLLRHKTWPGPLL